MTTTGRQGTVTQHCVHCEEALKHVRGTALTSTLSELCTNFCKACHLRIQCSMQTVLFLLQRLHLDRKLFPGGHVCRRYDPIKKLSYAQPEAGYFCTPASHNLLKFCTYSCVLRTQAELFPCCKESEAANILSCVELAVCVLSCSC